MIGDEEKLISLRIDYDLARAEFEAANQIVMAAYRGNDARPPLPPGTEQLHREAVARIKLALAKYRLDKFLRAKSNDSVRDQPTLAHGLVTSTFEAAPEGVVPSESPSPAQAE